MCPGATAAYTCTIQPLSIVTHAAFTLRMRSDRSAIVALRPEVEHIDFSGNVHNSHRSLGVRISSIRQNRIVQIESKSNMGSSQPIIQQLYTASHRLACLHLCMMEDDKSMELSSTM